MYSAKGVAMSLLEHAQHDELWLAVQITPELYWTESDFVRNVVITNNVFDSYYGGITLGAIKDGNYLPYQYPNHFNVTISNNIIRVSHDCILASPVKIFSPERQANDVLG